MRSADSCSLTQDFPGQPLGYSSCAAARHRNFLRVYDWCLALQCMHTVGAGRHGSRRSASTVGPTANYAWVGSAKAALLRRHLRIPRDVEEPP
jgi:hypothetical protein